MKHLFLTSTALILGAGASQAASVDFNVLQAGWANASGGNVIDIDAPYTDPASIAWGTNGSTPLVTSSGYTFDARDTPFSEMQPLSVFDLGMFTHYNNPINSGTSINSVDLLIQASIEVFDDSDVSIFNDTLNFVFNVTHDETTNNANPCEYADDGSDPGGDVNRNGCADRVVITAAPGSETFEVGGEEYTLNILGFAAPDGMGGYLFSSDFLSAEGLTNQRTLVAQFSAPAAIPLPAGFVLLLGGVGALGVTRKLRKPS